MRLALASCCVFAGLGLLAACRKGSAPSAKDAADAAPPPKVPWVAKHPHDRVLSLDIDRDRAMHAAYSPDGRRLATVHRRSIVVWDVATRAPLVSARWDWVDIGVLAWRPDGKRLAVGSEMVDVFELDEADGGARSVRFRS